ncbi:MAG TPA: hypothetical protein VGD56_18535 [Gemmatirosa sp.]
MNRRTARYVAALAVVAAGALATRVAAGADAPDGPAPAPATRIAHAMPRHSAHVVALAHPAHPVAAHAAAVAPDVPDTIVVERETFGYAGEGRRDPFRSLMVTAALRPLPSEVRLVAVAYDPTGVSSVAILRDGTTRAQYRVGVGGRVGRMRVVRIRPRTVVFAVEELGFSRTEVVTLSDSSAIKQP